MYRHFLKPALLLIFGAAMAGLVLSCGGGSSNNCAVFINGSLVSEPCNQTVPPLGTQLLSLNVCDGPPAAPTVKPTGAASPTPTHTPCPNPTSTAVMIPNPLQLNVAGHFSNGSKKYFKDLTSGAGWFTDNANLFYNSNGQFTTVNPGCSCVTASSGGLVGGPVTVAIAPNGGPFPDCSPCPAVATPTATPKAALGSVIDQAGSPAHTGKVMWSFSVNAPVVGRPAVAPSGGAVYFITADGLLHAVNSAGQQIFKRSAGGDSPVVGPNGTIYAQNPGGGLMALDAAGRLSWAVALDAGKGPLAAGPDNSIYVAAGDELVAVDGDGTVIWRDSMPGVRQVLVAFSGIIAVTDGGMTGLSSNGAIQWTFAPPAGIAGDAAIVVGTAYAVSPTGTLYAVAVSDGTETWERMIPGSSEAGVAASTAALYIAGTSGLSAIDPAGNRSWLAGGFRARAVVPAISSSGTIFVATDPGHIAAIAPDGTLTWIAGDFGPIQAVISASDSVYVVAKDGSCWEIKEVADSN